MKLDRVDEQILALLRSDGRMSNAQLAEAVGLSASACHRRLKALEASGVIRGYAAIIGERSTSEVMVVIVLITLDRQTDDYMAKFEAAVRKCIEVRECYLMAGLTDYLLRVEAASVADYERVHHEVLARLPGVARIQSNLALRSVVSPAMPLNRARP